MTPEEKRKEESAIMTTWLAGVMGMEMHNDTFENKEVYVINHKGGYLDPPDLEYVMDAKDFNPTEILEQAMEGAFKLGWDICLTGDIAMSGWHVDCTHLRKLITVSRYTPHSENANIIVTTLYEERKDK